MVGRRTRLRLAECTKDISHGKKGSMKCLTFSKVDSRDTHKGEYWLGVVQD